MIPTLVCIILLTDLSSGIPAKSPIQISTKAILRKPQNFKSAIEGHGKNERVERSTTSVARGPLQICEVEETQLSLTSDLAVAERVCRTPGEHPLLGEGYMCVQDHLHLSFSATNVLVSSGCSLLAVDSSGSELSPLAEDHIRIRDLELPSGLQIVAENRFCESIGENNGNYGLDGRDYFCHQQNLAVKTGQVSTLLPSGCVCYHRSFSVLSAATTTTLRYTLLFLLPLISYYCQ